MLALGWLFLIFSYPVSVFAGVNQSDHYLGFENASPLEDAFSSQLYFSRLIRKIEGLKTIELDHVQASTNESGASLGISQKETNPSKPFRQLVERKPHQQISVEDSFEEAFERDGVELSPDKIEKVSLEFFHGGIDERGWSLASINDHWPTLFWKNTFENKKNKEDPSRVIDSVPLIGNNTVKMLGFSHLMKMPQEEQAGIVFGRLAEGWKIELESEDLVHTGEPLFFDDAVKNQVSSLQTDRKRFFIFFNVKPGSLILTLRADRGDEGGGVFFPVMPKTATYLDLSEIALNRSLTGRLFDATTYTDEVLWSLNGSKVGVVGQKTAMADTDESGFFQIHNVLTVGSYPFYIESYKLIESESGELQNLGYPHRYRISPDNMDGLFLYRVSQAQIKRLRRQMSGTFQQPVGGIVFAAFTDLQDFLKNLRLSSFFESFLGGSDFFRSSLSFLSQDGSFLEKEAILKEGQNRIFGISLPEGPSKIGLMNEDSHEPLWKELLYISEKVVHILGPYSLGEIVPRINRY